jgi:hypothetical protein
MEERIDMFYARKKIDKYVFQPKIDQEVHDHLSKRLKIFNLAPEEIEIRLARLDMSNEEKDRLKYESRDDFVAWSETTRELAQINI